MAMLDRYKKKGGFVQLLNLLETSNKTKQEQFLKLIREESPSWENALRERILSVEKVFTWGNEALMEILPRIQPMVLSILFHGQPTQSIDGHLNHLGTSNKRKLLEMIAEANPNANEKATCEAKFIVEVRGLIQQGILKLEKIDINLTIPQNIEEQLNSNQINEQTIKALNKSELSTPSSPASSSYTSTTTNPTATKSLETNAGSNFEQKYLDAMSEVKFLKEALIKVTSENEKLKQELFQIKDKIDKIKKIA